jgi:hypothetical protein
MNQRSLGNATCFRAELPSLGLSSTAILRQTCNVTARSANSSRVVDNVRLRSLHHLSNAFKVASSRSAFVSTTSRKFRRGKSSTVLVNAKAPHPNFVENYVTEQAHSNGACRDPPNHDYSNGSVNSAQENQRREHTYVQPNGVPPFSAKEFESDLEIEAWELLRSSVTTYGGRPVGTIAAQDLTSTDQLNYDQVFIRDFIPSAIAFLLKGEPEIVREFLLNTVRLQVRRKDCS